MQIVYDAYSFRFPPILPLSDLTKSIKRALLSCFTGSSLGTLAFSRVCPCEHVALIGLEKGNG
jgi:hypothetical protein